MMFSELLVLPKSSIRVEIVWHVGCIVIRGFCSFHFPVVDVLSLRHKLCWCKCKCERRTLHSGLFPDKFMMVALESNGTQKCTGLFVCSMQGPFQCQLSARINLNHSVLNRTTFVDNFRSIYVMKADLNHVHPESSSWSATSSRPSPSLARGRFRSRWCLFPSTAKELPDFPVVLLFWER